MKIPIEPFSGFALVVEDPEDTTKLYLYSDCIEAAGHAAYLESYGESASVWAYHVSDEMLVFDWQVNYIA